ncbi:PREDICTED: RNA exonuclease 4 [Drosophila arizonae]|uniref:RNA exonuclease 4 n=1 Tax=Drosophila arizonae TaxID=7263 RepID=A0ABM1P4P3_DROAR|nr:PREDICTED: RNA exonuclease 4 [Drosophila arizonae]
MSSAQRQKQFDLNRGTNATANENKITMNTNSNSNSPGQRKLQVSMERLQVQQPNINRRAAGSNWQAAAAVGSENQKQPAANMSGEDSNGTLSKSARARLKRKAQRNRYLAMDCEMVGVGFNGQDDMLARVSIVNKVGEVLLDKHVKPRAPVTDYRTAVSGIRPHDIENGEEFEAVQDEVVKLLHGKILVGHALRNDLAVLNIKHPVAHIRDTSRYKPLCKLVSNGHTPSLKRLTMAVLGQEIQTGEHNSVEDARAAMGIYNRIAADWEKYLERRQ